MGLERGGRRARRRLKPSFSGGAAGRLDDDAGQECDASFSRRRGEVRAGGRPRRSRSSEAPRPSPLPASGERGPSRQPFLLVVRDAPLRVAPHDEEKSRFRVRRRHARFSRRPGRARRRLRGRAQGDRIHLDPLARPAVDRGDRRPCRSVGVALPARVQALGRADAEGLPAGADDRSGARAVARFGERARRRLRRRPVGPEPAARPVRRPRGADAGRLSPRRPRTRLRLSSLAVRRSDRRRRAARPRRPRLRRRRRPRRGARRHAAAMAARPLRRGQGAQRRRSPPAPSIRRNGGPTRRCGSS